MHDPNERRTDRPLRNNPGVLATILVAVGISLSACSSIDSGSDGWRASFFRNPDTVWAAIELSLLELDYEVTAKNRVDGVIRAQSSPTDDGTVIELAIDQVMRTEDEVNVYVKPSFGGDGASKDPDLLKAAAEKFIKVLRKEVGG